MNVFQQLFLAFLKLVGIALPDAVVKNYLTLDEIEFAEADLKEINPDLFTKRKVVGRELLAPNTDDLGRMARIYRGLVEVARSEGAVGHVQLDVGVDKDVRQNLDALARGNLLTTYANELTLNIANVQKLESDGIFVSLVPGSHRTLLTLMLSTSMDCFAIPVIKPVMKLSRTQPVRSMGECEVRPAAFC